MAYCTKCGEKINEGDIYCRKCGSKQTKTKKKTTKLVAAKCPSCGSNIDVDKNKKQTICEYCNTQIIIDDAIENYKVEISGEVEIKNLPKLKNLLKNANRNYDNEEYAEALGDYTAVLLLDPDISIAILRKGICKALTSNSRTLDIMTIINGFRDSIKYTLSEEEKTNYISESIKAMSKVHNFVMASYYNLNRFPLDEVEKYLNIQNLCLGIWVEFANYTKNRDELLICYIFIVNSLTELIFTRSYASGSYYEGREICYRYKHDKSELKSRTELAKKYVGLVKEMNIEKGLELEEKLKDSINKEFSPIIWFILIIIVCIMWWALIVYL